MDLVLFGLNHRTAPLSVRERWAFSEEEARQTLERAQDLVSGSENLILSTCNRTEIYSLLPGVAPAPLRMPPPIAPSAGSGPGATGGNGNSKNLDDLLDFFYRAKNFRREGNLSYFYTIREQAAVEHLFRVAAGLDSMIVGETQILRQLKDAFEIARQAGSVGKVFQRLFPAALKAGKRTRAETGIGEGCITHGQAAVKQARALLKDLRGRNVLLLGAGKVTELVAAALRDEGVGRVAVTSRTLDGARRLAGAFGGEAYPLGDLPCLLEVSDVVISSTGSTHPIVSAARLAEVLRRRPGRPICVIDLAVPRDFEPACADIPGVSLFNSDDLNEIVEQNIKARRTEIPRAEGILQDELRAFFGQMNWIHLDPVIRHIIERFEAMRVGEIERWIGMIPAEHRPAVEALTSSLVKKMLHFPIEKLKSLRDDAGLTPVEVGFLRRLFLSEPKAPHEPACGNDTHSHPHRNAR